MPHQAKIPFGPDVTPFFYRDRWIWIHPVRQKHHARGVRKVWRAKIEKYNGGVLYGASNYTLSRWQFAELVLRRVDHLIECKKRSGRWKI